MVGERTASCGTTYWFRAVRDSTVSCNRNSRTDTIFRLPVPNERITMGSIPEAVSHKFNEIRYQPF